MDMHRGLGDRLKLYEVHLGLHVNGHSPSHKRHSGRCRGLYIVSAPLARVALIIIAPNPGATSTASVSRGLVSQAPGAGWGGR